MTRTLPSDVVREIEGRFPFAVDEAAGRRPAQPAAVGYEYATRVRTIVDLCRQLPADLLPTHSETYARYRRALAELEHHVERWERGESPRSVTMTSVREEHPLSPLTILLIILRDCPDDRVAVADTELAFVTDDEVRAD